MKFRYCYSNDLLIGCWIGTRFHERGLNEADDDFRGRMQAKVTVAELNGM